MNCQWCGGAVKYRANNGGGNICLECGADQRTGKAIGATKWRPIRTKPRQTRRTILRSEPDGSGGLVVHLKCGHTRFLPHRKVLAFLARNQELMACQRCPSPRTRDGGPSCLPVAAPETAAPGKSDDIPQSEEMGLAVAAMNPHGGDGLSHGQCSPSGAVKGVERASLASGFDALVK